MERESPASVIPLLSPKGGTEAVFHLNTEATTAPTHEEARLLCDLLGGELITLLQEESDASTTQ